MVINLLDGVKEINSIQLLIDNFSENLLAYEQYITRLLYSSVRKLILD